MSARKASSPGAAVYCPKCEAEFGGMVECPWCEVKLLPLAGVDPIAAAFYATMIDQEDE